MYLWKCLKRGLISAKKNHQWEVGKWYKVDGDIKLGYNGFHASRMITEAMGWQDGKVVAKVEIRGDFLETYDQVCCEEMRVIKAWWWSMVDSLDMERYVERNLRRWLNSEKLVHPSVVKSEIDDWARKRLYKLHKLHKKTELKTHFPTLNLKGGSK